MPAKPQATREAEPAQAAPGQHGERRAAEPDQAPARHLPRRPRPLAEPEIGDERGERADREPGRRPRARSRRRARCRWSRRRWGSARRRAGPATASAASAATRATICDGGRERSYQANPPASTSGRAREARELPAHLAPAPARRRTAAPCSGVIAPGRRGCGRPRWRSTSRRRAPRAPAPSAITLAVAEQDDPLGERRRELDVVGRDDDARPPSRQLADQPRELVLARPVHPAGRLVEADQPGSRPSAARPARAIASASRWRSPPERSRGSASAAYPRPTEASAARPPRRAARRRPARGPGSRQGSGPAGRIRAAPRSVPGPARPVRRPRAAACSCRRRCGPSARPARRGDRQVDPAQDVAWPARRRRARPTGRATVKGTVGAARRRRPRLRSPRGLGRDGRGRSTRIYRDFVPSPGHGSRRPPRQAQWLASRLHRRGSGRRPARSKSRAAGVASAASVASAHARKSPGLAVEGDPALDHGDDAVGGGQAALEAVLGADAPRPPTPRSAAAAARSARRRRPGRAGRSARRAGPGAAGRPAPPPGRRAEARRRRACRRCARAGAGSRAPAPPPRPRGPGRRRLAAHLERQRRARPRRWSRRPGSRGPGRRSRPRRRARRARGRGVEAADLDLAAHLAAVEVGDEPAGGPQQGRLAGARAARRATMSSPGLDLQVEIAQALGSPAGVAIGQRLDPDQRLSHDSASRRRRAPRLRSPRPAGAPPPAGCKPPASSVGEPAVELDGRIGLEAAGPAARAAIAHDRDREPGGQKRPSWRERRPPRAEPGAPGA